MNLINNRFHIIEKKKDLKYCSLYLTKDIRDNNLYYLLFFLHNNLLLNHFNSFIDFILKQKMSLSPLLFTPLEFFSVNTIDEVKIETTAFCLIYPYKNAILLEEYILQNEDRQDKIVDKLVKSLILLKKTYKSDFDIEKSIIFIDNEDKPYFISIFDILISIDNKSLHSDISNLIFDLINNKINTFLNSDDTFLTKEDIKFYLDYFDNSKSVNNYLFNISQYIFDKIFHISENEVISPSYEKPIIYNFINLPNSFSIYFSEFLNILSIKGLFDLISTSASPDKFSLIYNIFDVIKDRYLNEVEFINIRTEFVSNDLHTIKKSIFELIYILSMKKPLFFIINNLNVADSESIKFLSSLTQIKNLHYPIFFIIFDFLNNSELSLKSNIYDLYKDNELINYIKEEIVKSFSKLFLLNEQDYNFLCNLEYQTISAILTSKPLLYLDVNETYISLKHQFIQTSIKNELDVLIQYILKNEDVKNFFYYFRYFEKPTPIKFFEKIFGNQIYSIINNFVSEKLIYIDEKNRLNSNFISKLRLIFTELYKLKYDKKTIIKNICDIYIENINDLSLREILLVFEYYCELKDYINAAKFVDKYILLSISINLYDIKNIFFNFLQKHFNYGKNIDLIEDLYSKLILKLFYYKLKYLDNDKKLEEIILKVYEFSSASEFHYRFVLEKILFFIKIHDIEKIEKDLEYIQKIYDNLPQEIKKVFLYAKAEDYFSRYDHINAIKTAKEALKTLCLKNKFDSSLYLPIMHRMVNSIVYSSNYKKAISYLKYFLNKALELKDIKYIFYAYNNLGIVNYRNKEFEKARNYMIKAYEYASRLKDKTLMFVIFNNLNLFEMDKELRIKRSKKMLSLAPFLAEKTYLILSFCNIFLYLLEEGNFEEIFDIISKNKEEIFQKFDKYSQFTIRRFLHLYAILLFPFLIFEKKDFLKLFYDNLIEVEDKIKIQDEKSEIRYLYYLIKPLILYIIKILEKKEDDEFIKLKNDLKNIFKTYSQNKDKIINTEFFPYLLGIYGHILFSDDEFEDLIGNMVKNFGNDTKTCNKDLIIYYRIKTNQKYTDIILLKYIEKYFKLHDIDPWSSSGIYFKVYIFLFYLTLLKKLKKIERLKSYIKIFYNYFGPFFEFLDTGMLFFENLKKDFYEIINLIMKYQDRINEKTDDNIFKDKRIFIFSNFTKFIKDDYEKNFYKKLLQELLNKFCFDRAILYIYENKEMRVKEKLFNEPILYYKEEPSFQFLENDLIYPNEPIYKKIKRSKITEILYLPVYFVNALGRIGFMDKYSKKQNQHYLLKGYIYLDSKTNKNRNLDFDTLGFCSLYISEFFERVQIETFYMYDYLTKVFTRENFLKKCNQLINLNKQSSNNAFFMIDIDDFKKINDTYGHQTGDFVLAKIAQTLKVSLRNIDVIGRYGGEEFTVFLPEISSENAYLVAERVRTNIENLSFPFSDNIKVTISIGISLYPQDGLFIEELLNKADVAMYKAKNKGKNRTEIYNF